MVVPVEIPPLIQELSRTTIIMARFDLHIGIDYSGAQTADARLPGLQVYATHQGTTERVSSPSASERKSSHWTRREVAQWLMDIAQSGRRFIAGIDHGFSLPESYFQRYRLRTWPEFLEDFVKHWPTHKANVSVDSIRKAGLAPLPRVGQVREFRLTERWTSSAKSVFLFDVQGSVAKSTHAGIPWLHQIRRAVGDWVHFWPFDGWHVPSDKSVLAEVYPSIVRNRFPKEERTADQQDAYAISRWLAEMDKRSVLDRYFHPPLTPQETEVAEREGWILGIT